MKIVIHENGGSRFWPEAYPYLMEADQLPLYHIEHEVRHPLGAFNNSLAPVEKYFIRVLNKLEFVNKARPLLTTDRKSSAEDPVDDLLEAYQALLYAVMEHIEACERIPLCFYPKERADKERAIKEFGKKRRLYRNHVASIVNAIKHQQNNLAPLRMKNTFLCVYGYYLVAPDGVEGIAPNRNIHKERRGMATAFSFSRDIKRILYSVYEVSHYVADFMKTMGIEVSKDVPSPNESLYSIAERVSHLPGFCFFDEVDGEHASVAMEKTVEGRQIILEKNGNRNKLIPLNGKFEISFSVMGDGSFRSIKIPYFVGER